MKTVTTMINVGDKIKIDRWNDGEPQTYEVKRLCRGHVNVKNDDENWAMPNNRIKDIEEIFKKQTE